MTGTGPPPRGSRHRWKPLKTAGNWRSLARNWRAVVCGSGSPLRTSPAAALAAIIVSALATLIALSSLWYAHRDDQRAGRAERRDATRLAGEQASTRVDELERVGVIMRKVAAAVRNPLDPDSPRQVHAGLARLEAAIGSLSFDLPACSDYASNADAGKLPAAERELEQAIAAARRRS